MEYSKIANSYNGLYGEEQENKLKIIKKILKLSKEDLLLDVGCGTGISTYYFEKDCNVIGIDPCKELIIQGKDKLILASAEKLPFENNYFDIIISVTAVHNFKDIEKGLLEIKRVLKKDGQLVLSILKKSPKFDKIRLLIEKIFGKLKKIEEEKDIIFFNQ